MSMDEWCESETLTKTCPCVQHARYWLAQAQRLNEVEGMEGHAFFTMGCAVNVLINHVDGKYDPL